MSFCSLHRHDHYSIYDGFGKAKDAVSKAQELQQTALALTNHGNVSGIIEHYLACKEGGIKPILGIEAYIQPSFSPGKKSFHATILIMNDTGYKNLMRLVS